MDGKMTSAKVVTVHADDDHLVAITENLLFSIENSEPSVPHLARVLTLLKDLSKSRGSSVGMLVVIRDDARPPSDTVRPHIVRLFSDIESSLAGLAYVMEGEGFIAAAKRSALTLMMAAKRYRFPVKVFRTVAEAVPWLAAEAGLEGSEFVPEIQELRARQYGKRVGRRARRQD